MKSERAETLKRERVALIAGSGRIPVFVADQLKKAGHNPFILAIEGEADAALFEYDHEIIYPGHPGRLLAILRRIGPDAVTMVGGVATRPNLRRIIPDWTTIRLVLSMLPKLRSGDDVLLRGVVRMIEDAGFAVRGVHEIVPDLLAKPGLMAGRKPTRIDNEAIMTAVAGATALGALDAGQACVAIGKRIVAMEAAEGTDLMLERVSDLRKSGRLSKRRGGVLVKLSKPGQDFRIDLPTIGVSTFRHAAAAGLNGVAVHAGNALIADYSHSCEIAEELGLFLIGIDPDTISAAEKRE